MTAPDHRYYLVEGDLRTPEDVLAWLARPRCCTTLDGHVHRLRRLLDEQRRQACRRGAHAMAREIAMAKRDLRYEYKRGYTFPDAPNGRRFDTFAECMRRRRQQRWGAELHAALAFRAAARQP